MEHTNQTQPFGQTSQTLYDVIEEKEVILAWELSKIFKYAASLLAMALS